jgi:hypothetical protein
MYEVHGDMDKDTAIARLKADGIEAVAIPVPDPDQMIVTLVGSARFRKEFMDANGMFSLMGTVVLNQGFFHEDYMLTPELKERADRLHMAKIAMCDFVFCINVDGYVGPSTAAELLAAHALGKPIFFHDRTLTPADLMQLGEVARGERFEFDFIVDDAIYPWDGVLARKFGIVVSA